MTDPAPDEFYVSRRAGEVDVLGQLDPDQRDQLCRKGQQLVFPDGENLIRAGDHGDFILVILEGEVLVVKPERPEAPLRLSAPLLSGEIAAYAGRPRNATVKACGPVRALRLERSDFLDAVRHSVAAGQALTELVAGRICAPDSLKTIGRYEVEGMAGKGGSGCVFIARDRTDDRRVALKMLSHALALIPGAMASFIDEAEMLSRLDHPSIIPLLSTFQDFDTCFIAMPWVEGQSLRARIDAGERFSAGDIEGWTRQLLQALNVMHQAGIAHCDIKPSNVLIDASRRAVLIDLGAGCFLGDERRDHRQFCGSPLYASPEQIMGRKPDGRSDIYALCCSLYELVYGAPPFNGATIEEIMNAHLRETPSFGGSAQMVAVGDVYLSWLRKGLKRARTGRPDAAASMAMLTG